MKIERAKGVYDVLPEEMILREEIISKIKSVFKSYGYLPLETPVIERLDVLTAKFNAAEGTDVSNEIFKLKDQGNRDLGLKFDQTVPLARFIAQNPTIKLPFKRYAIDRAFRDGPIKLGRKREFYQCDVDIVGSRSMKADAEIISLAFDVFEKLGLDIKLEVNNRKVLNGIMEALVIDSRVWDKVMVVIDKIKKISREDLISELKALDLTGSQIGELLEVFALNSISELKAKGFSNKYFNEGIKELEELFEYIDNTNLVYNPSLARGLNYYTGTIFEAFLKKSNITSSVAGGGRYDKMIGMYANNKDFPAVGIAFGLEPIAEDIKARQNLVKSDIDVIIIPFNNYSKANEVAKALRRELKVFIDINNKGISKNLDYANYYGIRFAIFIGDEEIAENKVSLKDLDSGEQKLLNVEEAFFVIKEAKR